MPLTVIVPADTYDLTVLDTVKDELGITDDSEDVKLSRWITQASWAIAAECNRVFALETVQERLEPASGSNALVLSRRPIVSVLAVAEDGSAVDGSGYEWATESGRLLRLSSGSRIYWGSEVTVEYQGGYALLGTLPYDLERACIQVVKQYRSVALRPDSNIRAEEIPGVLRQEFFGPQNQAQQSSNSAFTAEVAAMLYKYKDLAFA